MGPRSRRSTSGNLVFQTEGPINGVDEHPPGAFRLEVGGGAHGGGKHAGRLARRAGVRLRPGHRHHRIVLLAGHRRVGGFHAGEHLAEHQSRAVGRRRWASYTSVGPQMSPLLMPRRIGLFSCPGAMMPRMLCEPCCPWC